MPHISVMIPTYNRAHLLRKTIDSVVNQDFEDWDLVVVDDCSEDATVDLVAPYTLKDSRIRLIVNERNLGLTRNWNRCLKEAKGPLVLLLLSDDLIDSDYLRIVSSTFDNYPSMGFVAASCRYIDAEDRVTHPGLARQPKNYPPGDESVLALLTEGFPHVSSIVSRKECFAQVGGFDEKIWHGPDVEMTTRLAASFGFCHLGQIHTCFRRHGANMGALEYLNTDFLAVDLYKRKRAWGYLSRDALLHIGIRDLASHLHAEHGNVSLSGVMPMIAYGVNDLGRYYLRTALRYDHLIWITPRFWKALLAVSAPFLIRRLLQKRMHVSPFDLQTVKNIKHRLNQVTAESRS